MKGRKLSTVSLIVLMVTSSVIVFAFPVIPHRFYGHVIIEGASAPDGTLVEAKIAGITYESELTVYGEYGHIESNLFYVPCDNSETTSKEGGVNGDTVEFYVNGILATTYVFENGDITELILVIASATEITVSTDKASYLADELYTISGVTTANAWVSIDVRNPLDVSLFLHSEQADSLGAYAITRRLPIDAMEGIYTVHANIEGESASTTFIVIETGILRINTTPFGGEVFVDAVFWGMAPVEQEVEVGTFTVSFGDVEGYTTPSDEEVVVNVDATTNIEVNYVKISEIPAETTGEEPLDSTGAPKSSFTLGEMVLASAEVTNAGTASQSMLIVVQWMDPDYRTLAPIFMITTLSPDQSFVYAPGLTLPTTGYATGTWTATILVFDTWPALGGVTIGEPVTITIMVS